MSLPTSKQELADWILRRLGAPVNNVEIADVQLEDVIDEAVQFFQEYHYDGAERSYRVIKIEGDVLHGNNRSHQEMNAPMYDVFRDDTYRVGDRVMTYKPNSMPDKIWIKFDSEQQLYQYNYSVDSTGLYYHPSTAADTEFFVTTDAQKYLDSDFTIVVGTLTTYTPLSTIISDSDAGYTLYDSDLHNIFVYDADSDNGDWVDSDNNFVLYDSDLHTYMVYDSDVNGIWVDSDGGYVLYDSDTHAIIVYDSDLLGDWIDSDNSFRLWDSDNTYVGQPRYSRYTLTPQRYSRHTESLQRFDRYSTVNGNRYSRVIVKEFAKQYGWNDLWEEEQKVLTQPVIDYDYSKAGQVGIPVPDTIIGINKVFRIDNFSGMGMWNYEYQYFLNNFDFFYGNGGASSMPLTNYYTTKSYIDLIDNMMNVQPAIRFNKHRNRLYIDTNWSRLENMTRSRDYYLMIECYEVNDPEVFGDVYKDKWLKRYATALAKMQWGSNLKKYQNTELPGGLVTDGQALYDEGKEEAEKLEEELRNTQLELDFLIG